MPVAIEAPPRVRERGAVPEKFSFHREYVNHDRFLIRVTDERGTDSFEVRAWGNMIDAVKTFTHCLSVHRVSVRQVSDVYRTGYALVNGQNVRVIPIP